MAHYSFLKDLEASKKGVDVAIAHFQKDDGVNIRTLPKAEQSKGDFEVNYINTSYPPLYVEVKLDIMAGRTGNLCFEVDNGKKATGILATQADKIVYVVPKTDGATYKLFVFGKDNLLAYLSDNSNSGKFRLVRGGDRGRFGMVLVPIETIEKDSIAEEVVYA